MPPASASAVALVLGAALRRDGAPSDAMRRRCAHAAALWRAGRVGLILATGGALRHPRPEAQAMRDLLIAAGVPAAAIVTEEAARNTAQNIRLARPLLPPGAEVVLVTDRWHMPRARLIARAEGLAVTPAPAPPSGPVLPRLAWTLREGAALLKWLILRR